MIGINTAIATSTGSYQGYSFAIPVSLVKKIMDDLLEFGKVQRGLLGIQITDVEAQLAEKYSLSTNQGVLINRVNEKSAAADAGLKAQDVIVGINGVSVNTVSELQEQVARNRPGAEISVSFLRSTELKEVIVKLKNSEGNQKITKRDIKYELNGMKVEDVPFKELVDLQLEGGVRVLRLDAGKWKEAGLKEKFIISHIDKIPVNNVQDLNQILDFKKGGILIEGLYGDGEKGVYGLEW